MSDSQFPLWWKDIERSMGNSLSNFESLLDSMETFLENPDDISAANMPGSLNKWSALLKAASTASERITGSFNLAEARRRDVEAMGLNPPELREFARRSAAASDRSMKISRAISLKMALINHDISTRRPRRPSLNLFSENTPSHIDVHV